MLMQRTPTKTAPMETSHSVTVIDISATPSLVTRPVVKQSTLGNFLTKNQTPKRPRDENSSSPDPLQAILDTMERNQAELRQFQSSIFGSLQENSSKIDNLRQELTGNLEIIDGRVQQLESTVGKVNCEVGSLQRRLDELEQDKLESHMEINGVETRNIDANSEDLKAFSCSLIQSFHVNILACDISRIYVLDARENKKRLVVVFNSASVKASVMKAKREARDPRGIFFDHRMTPATKNLFMKTRQVAKEKGGRAILLGGRVFHANGPNRKTRIASLEDLSKIPTTTSQ